MAVIEECGPQEHLLSYKSIFFCELKGKATTWWSNICMLKDVVLDHLELLRGGTGPRHLGKTPINAMQGDGQSRLTTASLEPGRLDS